MMDSTGTARPGSLGRRLAVWLGSFLLAAIVLATYCRTPMGPLVWAGGLTLVITVGQWLLARRQQPLN